VGKACLFFLTATIEKRESKSKPDRGVVRQQLSVLNQGNEAVLTVVHSILVAKQSN